MYSHLFKHLLVDEYLLELAFVCLPNICLNFYFELILNRDV